MLSVHVSLPSGRSCPVGLKESRIREKVEAQRRFKRRFLRLAFRGQQLDASTLSEAGLRDGDSVDAIVQFPRLASTARDFALHAVGGTALF